MNLEHLRNWTFAPITQHYAQKDTMLYALGLGFGMSAMREEELTFVYEDGLKAVPSMCNTICHPGFWVQEPSLGIDWVKILHGEQSFTIHTPLPTQAEMQARYCIVSVQDKGKERGAVLTLEKRLFSSTTHYCTVTTTIFMRGDGGQGGFGEAPQPPTALPERTADRTIDLQTMPQIALIYRLSGDYNPIHASPSVARKAGFERPILHGLCTMGIATRALLQGYCHFDPSRLKSMFVRFSRPVFPGETIRTELFEESERIRFRCLALERDLVVLDRGEAVVA